MAHPEFLDFQQEAGRAGRDGLPAKVLLYYHGQQSTHCEVDVKQFLKSTGCVRVAAYRPLDDTISPLPVLHDCCSMCALNCNCGAQECTTSIKEPERNLENVELQKSVDTNTMFAFGKSHGFSSQLIEEVLDNCDKIFSLEDTMKLVPVFSRKHAILIFEIF